ncbi:MAG: hypothetical protein ACPHDR_06350, partial [Candidatus Puniceispirillaceae bacterium]
GSGIGNRNGRPNNTYAALWTDENIPACAAERFKGRGGLPYFQFGVLVQSALHQILMKVVKAPNYGYLSAEPRCQQGRGEYVRE